MELLSKYFSYILLTILIGISTQSCNVKSAKMMNTVEEADTDIAFIQRDTIFNTMFTGISVYSITDNKELVDYQADKLFTPASNTKTLSLYASLVFLPDSLTSFYYQQINDTLLLLPNYEPSVLHPSFGLNKAIDFLQDWIGPIAILNQETVKNKYFGSGWAWDDYSYYYQAEISDFPLYGNALSVSNVNNEVQIMPTYFSDSVQINQEQDLGFYRDLRKNIFYIDSTKIKKKIKQIPFVTSAETTRALLQDGLGKKVDLQHLSIADSTLWTAFYGIKKDTVLKFFMHESDNFIGEQLLHMIRVEIDQSSLSETIEMIRDSLFGFSDAKIRWVDGSGLSRYNLITPKFLSSLLTDMYGRIGIDGVKYYFPAGSKNGALNNYYTENAEAPYVYAKTGTLSNNHCLSGYLLTKKNKILAFSIMANHFSGSSSTVKPAFERLLVRLRDQY